MTTPDKWALQIVRRFDTNDLCVVCILCQEGFGGLWLKMMKDGDGEYPNERRTDAATVHCFPPL